MANLAQQLKEELTERAKNSESCKKYLLDWVMEEFRKGCDPVIIKCTNLCFPSKELKERMETENVRYPAPYGDLYYKEGRHYLKGYNKDIDITDLPDAQAYACDGKDESDKKLFLESEGFHVWKRWIYGKGNVLEINY